MNIKLTLDKEFSTFNWPLTEEESVLLEEALRDEGCVEPILYWVHDGKNIIVDGHNRYGICTRIKIPYHTAEMKFKDRDEALAWVLRKQLGRRNASEVQKVMLRAKLYELKKLHNTKIGRLNVAREIAAEIGISERQVYRDLDAAKTLEKLGKVSPKLQEATANRLIAMEDAKVLAEAPPDLIKRVESAPPESWRAVAKAAANPMSIMAQNPVGRPVGSTKNTRRPGITIKPLRDVEAALGRVTSLKAKALEACGGRKAAWAFKYHEAMRYLLAGHDTDDGKHVDGIFDILLAWMKEADARMVKRTA